MSIMSRLLPLATLQYQIRLVKFSVHIEFGLHEGYAPNFALSNGTVVMCCAVDPQWTLSDVQVQKQEVQPGSIRQ